MIELMLFRKLFIKLNGIPVLCDRSKHSLQGNGFQMAVPEKCQKGIQLLLRKMMQDHHFVMKIASQVKGTVPGKTGKVKEISQGFPVFRGLNDAGRDFLFVEIMANGPESFRILKVI